jgi:GT2 family glycosyltransferase
MADAPRVAAVVLARDRPQVVAETIAAIRAQDPAPDALVLVANEATDGVLAVLRGAAADHPDAEVVELARNLGAAGGFHAGIARVLERDDVDYVCCFDDDARPLPGCLRALRDAAGTLPDVGSVGAMAHDGRGRLSWPAFVDGEGAPARTVDELRALAARRGALPVAGLSWHPLMVPVAALRRAGNVWAELFHQYEDAEFGLRLRRAGLQNYLVAQAESVHPLQPPTTEFRLLGATFWFTRQAPGKEYLTLRNDLTVRRRYNGARFWYATLPFLLVRGLIATLNLDAPRLAALRHVYLRAVVDAARGRLGPPPARAAALRRRG